MDTRLIQALETKLVHPLYDQHNGHYFSNPPISKGTTALYASLAEMEISAEDPSKRTLPAYGRFGGKLAQNFEEAIARIEGGFQSVSFPSGLSAITSTLFGLLETGDHCLVPVNVYSGTKRFCESLKKMGIIIEYYSTEILDIKPLLRTNTKMVYMESPSSNFFEIQDVKAIAAIAKSNRVLTVIDNTWSTPFFSQPITWGVDIVIHSASKYICGHSDHFLGVATCATRETYMLVRQAAINLGQVANPEDLYAGLRGLKSLGVRMKAHQSNAIEIAKWLSSRPEVNEVSYPALETSKHHSHWRENFSGASGLFSFTLNSTHPKLERMFAQLQLFGLGHGWGGLDSLVVPVTNRGPDGLISIRIHVGLEDAEDLKKDLDAFLIQM